MHVNRHGNFLFQHILFLPHHFLFCRARLDLTQRAGSSTTSRGRSCRVQQHPPRSLSPPPPAGCLGVHRSLPPRGVVWERIYDRVMGEPAGAESRFVSAVFAEPCRATGGASGLGDGPRRGMGPSYAGSAGAAAQGQPARLREVRTLRTIRTRGVAASLPPTIPLPSRDLC